jgi:hypothetical protein
MTRSSVRHGLQIPSVDTAIDQLPPAGLSPLAGLLDEVAVIEHSIGQIPDPSSGHCVDDAGRALIVACRLPHEPLAAIIATRCLAFLWEMYLGEGSFRLRDLDRNGDPFTSDDANARALEGIALAATTAPWPTVRLTARSLFDDACALATPFLRSRAHAVVAAATVLLGNPEHQGAANLLDRSADGLERWLHPAWPWPEPRLGYANALIIEAMLLGAQVTGDVDRSARALHMLRWLVDVETKPGNPSPSPNTGRGPNDLTAGFDQQPIEIGHLTTAAVVALRCTGDLEWADDALRCAAWFGGHNDLGVAMFDPVTGRAFDGLRALGPNSNQGAESTIAMISTLIAIEDLRPAPPTSGERTASEISSEK